MAAAIISQDHLDTVDSQWKAWKIDALGADKILHEPMVRRGDGAFWFNGDRRRREKARESLAASLRPLDFTGIACVVDRQRYESTYGEAAMNASLPRHLYLMALDFLMERVVMALDSQFGSAIGQVLAESRGPKEDAVFQAEFVRLFLDGTSYVSASWFRHQLIPGIEFHSKEDNLTGLQLADLLARPCAEKVLNPDSTPDRWPEFRDKLCQEQETLHSILGLKIVPWEDSFDGVWKS